MTEEQKSLYKEFKVIRDDPLKFLVCQNLTVFSSKTNTQCNFDFSKYNTVYHIVKHLCPLYIRCGISHRKGKGMEHHIIQALKHTLEFMESNEYTKKVGEFTRLCVNNYKEFPHILDFQEYSRVE